MGFGVDRCNGMNDMPLLMLGAAHRHRSRRVYGRLTSSPVALIIGCEMYSVNIYNYLMLLRRQPCN